ncbi:hypothetical protein AB0G67_40130 [Streptomyces sp. NPDC021056]|uniref:hypothetical protein n=1 Tax=Streptomyces sp. NPDC021056 TaxID=3155012 RepID=UPI0033F3FBD9
MAKRDDFDDFFGDDDAAPTVDTRADGRLYRVPLGRLSPNLVNPRTEFGSEDDLIDFGKSLARRQNQPCPVVSRNAYLKLWPEHADQIGSVDYVLVSGERRYRGATAVGLAGLDCVVNDDFARDRKTFMEAVVSENVDRQNFDPIEEAYAVQALAREFGSNRAVAQHFERVDGWVTQRVLLTHLAPSMQALVRSKDLPLEPARKLGKLARDNEWDAGQQDAWWQEEQARRAQASQARGAAKSAAPAQPAAPAQLPEPVSQQAEDTREGQPGFTAVKPPPPAPSATAVTPPEPERQAVQPRPAGPGGHPEVVAQRQPEPVDTDPPTDHAEPRTLPYGDGLFVAQHLIRKMPPDALLLAIRLLNEHAEQEGLNVTPEHAS